MGVLGEYDRSGYRDEPEDIGFYNPIDGRNYRSSHWTWKAAIAAQEEREARRVVLLPPDEARRMRWLHVLRCCVSL